MRDNYDFTDGIKNPYTKLVKKTITINIAEKTIDYFKDMAETTGIPYQTLINMYLTDCATNKVRLNISWAREGEDRQR